jgi:hypothetical protein
LLVHSRELAGPVGGDLIHGREGVNKVLCIGLVDLFDSKVIYDKGETEVAGGVLPETRGLGRGRVAISGQVLGEALVGKDAGLFETLHPLTNLEVDPAIGCGKWVQVVLGDDFVWNHGEGETHIFVAVEGCVQVIIFDMDVMNCPSVVEIVLLMMHFAVVSVAVGVLVAPG